MVPIGHPLAATLIRNTLILNCVTEAYGALIKMVGLDASLGAVAMSPCPTDLHRRELQVEIDALVALMLHVTADELCTVYRTQFAVLFGYDNGNGQGAYYYDANGRLVPNPVLTVWRKKGDAITEAERTHTNASGNTYVYALPFRTFDREEDMRTAYAEFERRLRERS